MATPKQPQMPPHKMLASRESTAEALLRLQADQSEIEALFNQYDDALTSEDKQQIVRTLCEDLTVLTALEEVYFYPLAVDVLVDDTHAVQKSLIEHAVMKWLFEQLEDESPDSGAYDAKVEVLREMFLKHTREENREIFPKLRRRLLFLDEFDTMLSDAMPDIPTRLLH